jgi:hypothetical protein
MWLYQNLEMKQRIEKRIYLDFRIKTQMLGTNFRPLKKK